MYLLFIKRTFKDHFSLILKIVHLLNFFFDFSIFLCLFRLLFCFKTKKSIEPILPISLHIEIFVKPSNLHYALRYIFPYCWIFSKFQISFPRYNVIDVRSKLKEFIAQYIYILLYLFFSFFVYEFCGPQASYQWSC